MTPSAAAGVFVLQDEATLVPMQAASFASEDDFQRLLARFPALLAGDQIDADVPRRFVLIGREQGIASEKGESDRWSLDHLFVDQDGVPTLVEVKRSTDPRLRREVIGQMLDYAANAVLHWPVEGLRANFAETCRTDHQDPVEVLAGLIGPAGDPDSFWRQVETNLEAGRIRLLFVADRIPRELRNVVEFLNRQMQPAEVLAVELRQYEGRGLKTLVPLVIGQTRDADQRRSRQPPRPERSWDDAAILASISEREGPAALAAAEAILAWMHQRADRVVYNSNPIWGWVGAMFVKDNADVHPLRLHSEGTVGVYFQYMLGKPVFADETRRQQLLDRLNEIPGIALPPDAITKRRSVALADFTPETLAAFLVAMDWWVNELRRG